MLVGGDILIQVLAFSLRIMDTEKPYVCTLSPELVKKAEKELNEKAKWRSRDVQALRDMLKKEKGI